MYSEPFSLWYRFASALVSRKWFGKSPLLPESDHGLGKGAGNGGERPSDFIQADVVMDGFPHSSGVKYPARWSRSLVASLQALSSPRVVKRHPCTRGVSSRSRPRYPLLVWTRFDSRSAGFVRDDHAGGWWLAVERQSVAGYRTTLKLRNVTVSVVVAAIWPWKASAMLYESES